LQINEKEKISWKGKHRAAINNLGVYPRASQDKLPVWVAVGGTPASAIRAAKLGLPMAVAIIGGGPQNFVSFVQLYRDNAIKAGNEPKVGINSHVYIADDSQQAADEFYPTYIQGMNKIGRERGWQPMTREHYEMMRSSHGSLLVGSPEEVTDKILYEYELFRNDRFLAQMSVGTLPHAQMMRSIELLGTKVAPAVRKAIANQKNMVGSKE
jgi:alkanesulfonate monooxygenase SsuD/methylene tetrahydromethanopterin reductase-like flavin-dependent oxidoreductase (luciferase family)